MITNSIGMKLTLLPSGKYTMGSPKTESERDEDEIQHPVIITRPFYMGVCEVTQAEYQRVMEDNPSFFKESMGGGPSHPVEQATWREVRQFCQRLSDSPEEKKAGRSYRLPTEAEWEYACRAGTTTAFHYGKSLSSMQANFNGNFSYGNVEKGPYLEKTSPVGSYPPNSFGLYDMHGNVWEWCADWYDPDYYQKSPRENPPGPAAGIVPTGFAFETSRPGNTGFYVVVRGGSWLEEGRGCRAAYRFRYMPNERFRLVGFRVVCNAPADK
jgi:formylglycine-generating enzyme required for sulfatase activity